MSTLFTPKRILLRSLRRFLYLTLCNLIASIIIALFFTHNFTHLQLTSDIGNFALFEAMVLFFVASAVDISHSAKWSTAMKLLKLSSTTWTLEESRMAERDALVHVLTGVFLILELPLLILIPKM